MSEYKQLKIVEEDFEVDVIDEEEVSVPARVEPAPISMKR